MRSQIIGAHLGAVRSFVLAVDAGSLTEAGRRLGLTPSAVSKQLGRFEEALGARLLERTTRRIRPTAAGLALYQRAQPLLEALDEAGAAVHDLQTAVRGRVRLSASRAFGRVCVVPVIARLAAEHSELEIDLVLDARRLDFIEDDLDLAVREGPLPDSSLTARKLGAAAVALYAAPAYLARRRPPRSLEELVHHDVLAVPASGPASDLRALRGRNGKRLGLVPRIRVNDLLALADLAERGAGIAILPDYAAAPALARHALVPVLPRKTLTRIPLHALYPGRRHLPRRVQVVLDALIAAGPGGGSARV
jgi:DNA-binding transcriptional LysR family regulator